MKRLFLLATIIVTSLFANSCAKHVYVGPNEANKRYFDAWLQVNNIDVKPSGRGIYVLENTPGNGEAIKKDGFVFMDYTTYDLDGNILTYTTSEVAKQVGTYDYDSYSCFYGPQFLTTYEGNIYAGIADMLLDMKVGGSRKAIIPGWLFSYDSYATEKEYLEKTTSSDAKIYEVKIKDFTTDIDKWEIDSIGRFFNNDKVLIDGIAANKLFTTEHGWTMTAADSVSKGFYYKQLKAPVDTTSFKADTTIYINYTGRLLNGQVFDTTIEDVAKDNNIWSSSRTYKPSQINWAGTEDNTYKGITMGSDDTSVISGFAMTLWQMRSMEKGIGVFFSPLGYRTSGSGKTIPAYSPLIFEIEIVEKPEE